MRLPRALALAALLAAGCSDRRPAPAPPDAGAAGAGAAPAGEVAYVIGATALRREPTEASRVAASPPKRSQVSNFLATLLRGEKVTVLEERGEWIHVRVSDESEGWLKKGAVLVGVGVTEATLTAQADAFDRPDLLAVNVKRKIEPATLLLVVRSRELFSEVNVGSGPTVWLLTDRLATGQREVMVAKLIEKARWLVRAQRLQEARAVLELARSRFADVPLVQVLAAELGEAPAAGGEQLPLPASPFAPAPPPPPGSEGR